MNLNVTTQYTTHPVSGAGKIVAKGHGRQSTVSFDHSISHSRNHGRAAAALANKIFSPDEQRGWLNLKHDDLGNGKHRFYNDN